VKITLLCAGPKQRYLLAMKFDGKQMYMIGVKSEGDFDIMLVPPVTTHAEVWPTSHRRVS
jgi:hypothetical protein